MLFTSGHENPHWVEIVTKGTRKTLTFFFSCISIDDAQIQTQNYESNKEKKDKIKH